MHVWRFWQRDYANWRELLGTDSKDDYDDAPMWRGQTYVKPFEPHDPETKALIRQWQAIYNLAHGETVAPLLDKWRYMDRMSSPAEKQRFLEPLITKMASDPAHHCAETIFLMLVCEPVRRGVARQLVLARHGLDPVGPAPDWHRREEAKRLREIEKHRLYEVTFDAALEALYRYPTPPPARFFPWLRATVAHRALDFLRAELVEGTFTTQGAEEAEAMALALAGFDAHNVAEPARGDGRDYKRWRRQLAIADIYHDTQQYFEFSQVKKACNEAIGRLPRMQQAVIRDYFFDELGVDEIASRRKVKSSTVYNHKAQAQKRLGDDDVWFMALWALGKVRDRVRADRLRAAPIEQRLPDGRRRIVIDEAA